MTQEQADGFFKAIAGLSKEEWEQLRGLVDQEYEANAKAVQFSRDNESTARRLLAMQNDWPYTAETYTQTKMGF